VRAHEIPQFSADDAFRICLLPTGFRRSVVKLRLQRAITGRRVFAFRIYPFSFSKTTLITAVVICCLVTIFAIRALIYTLTILGLGFPSCARLRRSDSSLVPP